MHVHSDPASIRGRRASMTRPTNRMAVLLATLGLALTCAPAAHAADQKAVLAKIKAHYQSAAASYDDGDLDKTQGELQQALTVGGETALGAKKRGPKVSSFTGALGVAGPKEKDQGVKYFPK